MIERYRSAIPLALAVLTAALLQALLIARSPTISADGILFISIARELPGEPIATLRHHDQHPGYPALLLAGARTVQWLGDESDPGSWVAGAHLVTFVCGLLSVVIIWCFARDLFDTRVANIAAFIFAILPIPRSNAADALSDTPHAMFYLLAAWLACSAVISGNRWRLAAAGLASGLAYWIRPEGLEVCLIALACVVLQAWRAWWSWPRTGAALAALAGTAFVVAAPYPILAGKITSKQLPFAKTEAAPTFIAQLAEAPQAEPVAAPSDEVSPAPTVATEPAAIEPQAATRYTFSLFAGLAAKGIVLFLVTMGHGFKFVFAPLYLVGHVELVRRKPDWLQIGFIALLGAAHVAILLGVYILSGYIAKRHVIPLVGLAMPFTALGVIYLGELAAGLTRLKPVYVVPAFLGLCSMLVLYHTAQPFNGEFVPVIEATHWVNARAEQGAGVVSNSPYVAFHGQLPTAFLGHDMSSVDEAVCKAPTEARYEYVVLHVNAHDYRPQWLAQLEPYYRQVQQFDDPTVRHNPKKVLVLQANEGQARRPERRSPF